MFGMVVLRIARGPLVGIELNVARSQASACKTYHSIDIYTRLVVRSGQLSPSLSRLAHCLTSDSQVCLSSPTQPNLSTTPSPDDSSLTERTPRH